MTQIVTLDWDDPNSGNNQETEVRIYRSQSSFDSATLPTVLDTVPADSLTYQHITDSFGFWFYGVGMFDGTDVQLTVITVDLGADPALFDVATLFANSEVGYVCDPSDGTTLFTDTGGTTSAAIDDAVARVNSFGSSGGTETLQQSTASRQPIYRADGAYRWLEFDGSNDVMQMPGTDSAAWSFLHDATGGEVIMGIQVNDNIGENIGVILDTANTSGNNIGRTMYYDDRKTLSPGLRHRQLHYVIARGGGISSAPVDSPYNGFISPGKDMVLGSFFQDETGNDGGVYTANALITGGRLTVASTNNPSDPVTICGRSTGLDLNTPCRVYFFMAINRVLTDPERLNLSRYIETLMPQKNIQARLHSFETASRIERFVDLTEIEDATDVVFDIRRPVKFNDGPISEPTGVNSATWDRDKYFPAVDYRNGDMKILQGCWDDLGSNTGVTLSNSVDGRTVTKPDLGINTYGGNTSNNIVNTGYDPTIQWDGSQYLVLLGVEPGVGGIENGTGKLYTSPDLITLTEVATFFRGTANYSEFHGMTIRSDGRIIVYYITGHPTDDRRIGAFLSDTTDPAGGWTDQGVIYGNYDEEDQFYTFSATLIDGILYGAAYRFNDITERMWVDLFTSQGNDGLTLNLVQGGWIPNGKYGEFDGGFILGKHPIVFGDELRLYYGAANGNHIDSLPRDSRLAYATVPLDRMCSVIGVGGSVTTTALTLTDELYINAISSGGNLSVEVLDAGTDTPLAGFAKTDCDVLDGDHKSLEVTWGGISAPTGSSIKLKFYLDA